MSAMRLRTTATVTYCEYNSSCKTLWGTFSTMCMSHCVVSDTCIIIMIKLLQWCVLFAITCIFPPLHKLQWSHQGRSGACPHNPWPHPPSLRHGPGARQNLSWGCWVSTARGTGDGPPHGLWYSQILSAGQLRRKCVCGLTELVEPSQLLQIVLLLDVPYPEP